MPQFSLVASSVSRTSSFDGFSSIANQSHLLFRECYNCRQVDSHERPNVSLCLIAMHSVHKAASSKLGILSAPVGAESGLATDAPK